jgi:GDP-4-dehydro-6-deoxy-D-mannose reductase
VTLVPAGERRRRVIVTGANGYLASRIVAAVADVAEVVPVVRPDEVPSRPKIFLNDAAGLASFLGRLAPDHVIHAAGRVTGKAALLWRDNVDTTRALGEAIVRAAPRAVFSLIGSAAEYGAPTSSALITEDHPCQPLSDYGRSKAEATRAALSLADRGGLRLNVVRPFNLIGAPLSPAQVLGAFVARAAAARDDPHPRRIVMGCLDAVRDFVAVDDLLLLLATLVTRDHDGAVVNVCSGVGRCVRDVVAFLNGLPGGGFIVEEIGSPPPRDSVVIGDPTRMLRLIGRDKALPIEPVLERAWREAVRVTSAGRDCACSLDA